MKGYPFERRRGSDGRWRADHEEVLAGLRSLASSLGWHRPVEANGDKRGDWRGPRPGQYLPFL